MPPQEIAFAAPTTEQMTKVGAALAGAGVAGVVEGVMIKMAPGLGELQTPFTWATLLGVPAVGIAGSLFTRGMLGDLFQGIAAFGTGYAASVMPAMLMPDMFGKKAPGQTAEQRAALAAANVKQLPPGPLNAPQRAQEAAAKSARVGLDF